MRKNQPVFVVEYKAGRRQKGRPKTSIWGSVDFASLTREIEHDLPARACTVVSGATDGNGEAPQEPRLAGVSIVEPESESLELPISSEADLSSEFYDDEKHGFVFDAAEERTEDTASSSRELLAQELGPDDYRGPADHSHTAVTVPSESDIATAPPKRVSRQELVELDVENAELRKLLRNRLETENRLLRQMAERHPS